MDEEEEVKMRTNRGSTADPQGLPAAVATTNPEELSAAPAAGGRKPANAAATLDMRKLTATAAYLSEESDHQIARKLQSLSRSERRITLEILLHLIEAEKRKLHVKKGTGLFSTSARADFATRSRPPEGESPRPAP